MSFVSIAFLGVLLLAGILRFTVGRNKQGRAYLVGLYGLSLLFYAWHVPAYLALILASTATDYWAAMAIEGARPGSRRRTHYLIGSLVVNLGLLGYFKYAGFLLETSRAVAQALGLDLSIPTVQVILPIGISFYTFQSMSYTIDVYRGELSAEKRFWRLGLYVSFFPQLVAGPIVRAREFFYQLPRRRRPRQKVFARGTYLVLRGLFLKMVIADNLGAIVDEHWETAANEGAPAGVAWSLLVMFSCQLFADFAGYSDIARGIAYLLGFRLPRNFDAPFIATSFREFWRRWHMTLSRWFRDYLYIPLGGGRLGVAGGVANLMVVMCVSGLWHGANLTFLLWGAVHGAAAAVERLVGPRAGSWPSWLGTLGGFLLVQSIWILSMSFFRSATIDEAWGILGCALGFFEGRASGAAGSGSAPALFGWWFVAPVALLHLRAWLERSLAAGYPRVWERALYAGVMLYAVMTLYGPGRGFIYFQF